MVSLNKLIDHLDKLLQNEPVNDYCPNGLQVSGREQIQTLVTGVSASQALLDAALDHKADAVLVHHGFFWRNESPTIVGLKHSRLATIIKNDLSLIAYHLPLDIHPVYGNNAQLAQKLDLIVEERKPASGIPGVFFIGKINQDADGQRFCQRIGERLQREPLYIPGKNKQIQKIAWCTGAAQDFIDLAIAEGCDAFLTGEVSERTVPVAKEAGIHFYSAGHHATERYGVQAVGEYIAQSLGISHQFIDIDNPV